MEALILESAPGRASRQRSVSHRISTSSNGVTPNTTDTHWDVNGNDAVATTRNPLWIANGTNEDSTPYGWISYDDNTHDSIDANDTVRSFTTTVTVPASANLGALMLSGRVASDNRINDILVNGVSTGIEVQSETGYGVWTPITLTAKDGLTSGTNVITFLVQNDGRPVSNNPTGLVVDWVSSAPPERFMDEAQEYDAETGMHYSNAPGVRYREGGLWITQDPAQFGTNFYTQDLNNGITYVDTGGTNPFMPDGSAFGQMVNGGINNFLGGGSFTSPGSSFMNYFSGGSYGARAAAVPTPAGKTSSGSSMPVSVEDRPYQWTSQVEVDRELKSLQDWWDGKYLSADQSLSNHFVNRSDNWNYYVRRKTSLEEAQLKFGTNPGPGYSPEMGSGGASLAQGGVNAVQGLQNGLIGLGNLGMTLNPLTPVLDLLGYDPTIPSPDWSKNMFANEYGGHDFNVAFAEVAWAFATAKLPFMKAPKAPVNVFRVEGAANARILIGESGEVVIQGDKTLFLNFGNKLRAEAFLTQRMHQGMSGATIKSFKVPQSFLTDLQQIAVPMAKSKLFSGRPIIVDVTKAPNQFGLRPEQIRALQKAAIQGSGKVGG